ncbi:MAG TPA: hypothetical protein VGK74_19655 [Symbiobacteriaceae bacterium]
MSGEVGSFCRLQALLAAEPDRERWGDWGALAALERMLATWHAA